MHYNYSLAMDYRYLNPSDLPHIRSANSNACKLSVQSVRNVPQKRNRISASMFAVAFMQASDA